MFARPASTGSFLFLFDRAEVDRFLSPVRRRVLKQRRGGGGLQRLQAERFLLHTGGRVPRQALVALGPLAVAGGVVRAGQAVQREGGGEGGARFGKTWIGGGESGE